MPKQSQAFYLRLSFSLILIVTGCTGPVGPMGPQGATGAQGSAGSASAPVPTPTLMPTATGSAIIIVDDNTGATINLLIDGVAPNPSSMTSNTEDVQGCPICAGVTYSLTPGGHRINLSMSASDETNFGFEALGCTLNYGYLYPTTFPVTNSFTFNFNIPNTLVEHGFVINPFNTEGVGPVYSIIEID